jgi:RNA-directed DNA polymerase
MQLGKVGHQKRGYPERAHARSGEAAEGGVRDETEPALQDQTSRGQEEKAGLIEQALSRANLVTAWKRVKANKGSCGVDGRSIEQTASWLKQQWPEIRASVLDGSYRPAPVRRVDIAKPGGGIRQLGIPCVVDRLIQQALLQVLQPIIDPQFSEHSYGFRPGRSAHDAVMAAQQHVQAGCEVVVDVDLESFFDHVNHDILMERLARRIADRKVLGLIRRYLRAGVMAHGVCTERHEGTPQGGPLSPLLANVLLDDVDRELTRRGHRFVRYADDCNVYVGSLKAGQRVLAGLRKLYGRLRLKVNEAKTAVASVWGRKFLGYCFWRNRQGECRRGVARQALQRVRERLRQITWRGSGRSMAQVVREMQEFVPGWRTYFRLAQTPRDLRDLDAWVRRRLRALQLKQWKHGQTIYRELCKLGATPKSAAQLASSGIRWWRRAKVANSAIPVTYFDQLGVPRFA